MTSNGFGVLSVTLYGKFTECLRCNKKIYGLLFHNFIYCQSGKKKCHFRN